MIGDVFAAGGLMKIRAIIFDLDNTIYPVKSVGDAMFASLFDLIEQDGGHSADMLRIKDDIMRIPFQKAAIKYGFSQELTKKGNDLLQQLEYNGPIEPFPEYAVTRGLEADKYLVTTGFSKLQQSKVKGMQLEKDFREIHIVDPSVSARTKKDVFYDIMARHGYLPGEVIAVGDDPESEITAARELGMRAVLYDNNNLHPASGDADRINSFMELESRLGD